MKKNKAAVTLGRLRAKTLTTEERSKGGKTSWAGLDEEGRKAEMRRRKNLKKTS